MEQGGACRRSAPFRCAKPRWPVTGPTGAAILPSPSRLRRAGAPTAKTRRLSGFIRPPFRLRRNRAGRSSAPPGPLFCRSRHGCAAPGPQRQNPGACRRSAPFRLRETARPDVSPAGGNVLAAPFSLCSNVAPHFPAGSAGYVPLFHGWPCPRSPRRLSPFGSISLRETALAGRCPRRGQRARYPIFALLKCGPAFSRGVCRGTFPCSPAGPALAPRRLSPFGSISLRETALAGRCPRRGQRARCPIFALLKCGPALAPRRSAPFHPKTIVRFRMSVSPEFSVFFICPPPFFCIGSGAHRYTKIRGGDTPPRI